MAEAVFYDGEAAQRRAVSVRVTASSLDIYEGEEWIASWPTGGIRRKDAPYGVLRLTCGSSEALARLDITDPEAQAAVHAYCERLDEGDHKERTGRILLWSVLAALSLIGAAVFLLPVIADRLTPLVPASLERRIGHAVDNQLRLLLRAEACSQTAGSAALDTLVARLKSGMETPPDFEIVVIDSKIPNATALPGGRIYLLKGLLDKARSVDEVAGVLAHEIGHVAHRDGLRTLIQSSGTSYLIGLLFGDVAGGGAVVLASQHLLDSAYSREAEAAADAFAGRTMLALGRRADPMARLLKRIEGNETRIPAFLSSHPLTDQRLKTLESLVPVQEGSPLITEGEWRALKEICKTS